MSDYLSHDVNGEERQNDLFKRTKKLRFQRELSQEKEIPVDKLL